jgi:hypothetical protein
MNKTLALALAVLSLALPAAAHGRGRTAGVTQMRSWSMTE